MTDHELIRGTVARVAGGTATITFSELEPSGQTLVLPIRAVPQGAKAGDTIVIELLADEAAAARRDATARKLLEDILNGK